MQAIIEERARKAWQDAWDAPRWAFSHGEHGRVVLLPPAASAAIEAGAADGTELPLGDGVSGRLQASRTELAVDGNVHKLRRARRMLPQDIEVGVGLQSPHLDVRSFLTELHVATGIAPARIHVHIGAAGTIESTVAPSDAWVDPLLRRCFVDHLCVQQFIGKYKIGSIPKQAMHRLFGWSGYCQHPDGTPEALLPFVAPVRVVLDERWVVDARYDHTVNELLDALPSGPIYLHGIQLRRCALALWTLSPVSHGIIHVYRTPAERLEKRHVMGGYVILPDSHRTTAFVPCVASFTGNAFAPAMYRTAAELAAMAPALPTRLYMEQLTQCEPMTISRAQCIYRHLSTLYKPHDLRRVLLAMALPEQHVAMDTLLATTGDIPVHPTFARWVQQVAEAQRAAH